VLVMTVTLALAVMTPVLVTVTPVLGGDDPCAGDGSDWAGGDSVAKAPIALQALELPEPVALTFQ
jgi:hypothetical protein